MVFVQMGFLSDALDYIFEKILDPVFDLLSELMETILGYLFNNVLTPILNAVLGIALDFALDLIMEFVSILLLTAQQGVLLILDIMQRIFSIYIGLSEATNLKTGEKGSMLLLLLKHPPIIQIMLALLLAGFAFCFLCALFATIRAIGNLELRQDRTVAHVMRTTGRAMVRFVTAPLMALFLIVMADSILLSINNAFTGTTEEQFSIARTIFAISTLDAIKPELKKTADKGGGLKAQVVGKDYNASTGDEAALDDPFRAPFFHKAPEGEADYYLSQTKVMETFEIKKIDYLIGILVPVLFVAILLIADLFCIERIFGVLVLLFVEPFFIATMPLDDGKRFDKWQDLFFGKLFSAYGIVISMNLYLMIMAAMYTGRIALLDPATTTGRLYDYVVKMVFMLGAGFALWVSGSMVTSILNPQVASQEQQTKGKVIESVQNAKKIALMIAAAVATGGAGAGA
ncbi:MAG: hypothetical protein K5696_13080, partial [Lachnospiraceae bacterium]|nr:hypothetical protein [Lachnospiraceae bacterium]